MNTSTKLFRPLTARMLKYLQECYDRELSKQSPLSPYYSQSTKGLYERGFLCTIEYELHGRIHTGFTITRAGKDYLRFTINNKGLSRGRKNSR